MNLLINIGAGEMLTRKNVDIDCFGMTDVGQQRAVNQDHFLIGDMCASHSSIQVDGEVSFEFDALVFWSEITKEPSLATDQRSAAVLLSTTDGRDSGAQLINIDPCDRSLRDEVLAENWPPQVKTCGYP